jgi:hypothetical protein
MTKASVNLSNKCSSAKKISAKNTATLDTPSNTKKMTKVEKFSERMRKKCNNLPAIIVDDMQVHSFDENNELWVYILSTSEPAMGFFGCLTSDDDPMKWAFAAKDKFKSIAATKEVKLRKLFNKARTAALDECDDSEFGDVDVFEVDPDDLSDAEPSKEPADEGYETTVSRLSALSDRDYDLVRKLEAKRFGVRVSTLDRAVTNEQNHVTALKIMGPRLLTDVYEIVTSLDVQQIGTATIISELCAGNNKIWSVFNRGDQIDPKTLAHILSLYGVTPRDLRFGDVVLKGYTRASIVAAYTRYISSAAQPQPDDSSE